MVSDTDTGDLQNLCEQLQEIVKGTSSLTARSWRLPIIESGRSPDESDSIHHLGTEPIQGLKSFVSSVSKEIETIEKYLGQGLRTSSQVSTNALYHLSVWKEIQASNSIVALGKAFNFNPSTQSDMPSKASVGSVKVDVVCDDGASWIRINTIKQSRMKAELNDLDAWGDSSGSESEDVTKNNSLQQLNRSLDNSVYRMGVSLLEAAEQHRIPGTDTAPKITLRLTRLIPGLSEDAEIGTLGLDVDRRVRETVDALKSMGINILFGEKTIHSPLTDDDSSVSPTPSNPLPTRHLNLDLSFLVALVSDITHSSLPKSEEESITRYQRLTQTSKRLVKDLSSDQLVYSRALSNQAEQERQHSMLDDVAHWINLSTNSNSIGEHHPLVTTWTTPEAKARLDGIMAKIGGPAERRRASAMFAPVEVDAEKGFWDESRFPIAYIKGLVPVKLFHSEDPDISPGSDQPLFPFHIRLATTCDRIIQELKNGLVTSPPAFDSLPGLQDPADESDVVSNHVAIKAMRKSQASSASHEKLSSPALTLHTTRSLLWGALTGMTTLTANRASVKAVLREMAIESKRASDQASRKYGVSDSTGLPKQTTAVLWIVEPRSLVGNVRTANEESDT